MSATPTATRNTAGSLPTITLAPYPNAGLNVYDGTSGIIIDNSAVAESSNSPFPSKGASQIYTARLYSGAGSRIVNVTHTSGSTAITANAGVTGAGWAFTQADVGATIAGGGTGIGTGDTNTIVSVTDSTHATLASSLGVTSATTNNTITYRCPAGGGNPGSNSQSCAIQASQAALQ
jgi:hypothetical protein